MRLVRFAVLAGLCTLLLTSCFQGKGAVRVSEVNGDLAIAFCDARTITAIQISQLAPGGNRKDDWEVLWRATGAADVKVGEVWIVGQQSSPLTSSEYVDGLFNPDEGFEYELIVDIDGSGGYFPVLESPSGGLMEGKWVDNVGNVTDEPCE